MPKKKIAVDTAEVKKPMGNGLRSQIARMNVNEAITLSERVAPKEGEAHITAAMRVSQELRNRHSRSVTDARQKTGNRYTTSSSRKWENDAFTCYLQIIRIA